MREGEFARAAMPALIQALPVFEGAPVPWFAAGAENGPDFAAGISDQKFERAKYQHVCVICGRRLRPPVGFFGYVLTPMERAAFWPPAHVDCAAWSMRHCPFMRRVGERDPHVKMVWITRRWSTVPYGAGPDGRRAWFLLGPPRGVEWYVGGRAATRAEVLYALRLELRGLEWGESGQYGRVFGLGRRKRQLERWLPVR
jgi:hypothetical protein